MSAQHTPGTVTRIRRSTFTVVDTSGPRPIFLRGYNGRLRLVQEPSLLCQDESAEVDTVRYHRVTSESKARYGAALEKPACDSSGALVFWACIGFGVWLGVMFAFGWLN